MSESIKTRTIPSNLAVSNQIPPETFLQLPDSMEKNVVFSKLQRQTYSAMYISPSFVWVIKGLQRFPHQCLGEGSLEAYLRFCPIL